MLDLNKIREQADEVAAALKRRGYEPGLDSILNLDGDRRSTLGQMEELKRQRNASSKQIGQIMKSGGDATELKEQMRQVGDQIAQLEQQLGQIEAELHERLIEIPNVPEASVPDGQTDADNVMVRQWGQPPEFSFDPRDHVELGTELGILDFDRAAKLSGARFVVLVGAGARLERALIQFMLDVHTREHGYREVIPPFLVHRDALVGTGQLPKFEEDLFKVEPGGFYLIPTAEVPLTNLHRDEILDAAELPRAYCAYTPCFRSEAGSYGQDVRGLIRQHQFNKVELVHFARPEESYQVLEQLTRNAETVLQRLELPYRVVNLCGGDLGFSSAKTYDIEVWIPSQQLYREISSCSNCEAFQARRAKIRYRPAPKEKARLLHTLNGSGLAVGRTLVAILENFQQEDGSVVIPEALRPYLGGQSQFDPTPADR